MADDTNTPPRAAKRKRISREPLTLFPNTPRQCSKCREHLPATEFPPNRHLSDGLQTYCRLCSRKYQKAWRTKNKERKAAAVRRWIDAHPHQYKRTLRSGNLKRKYGIDADKFDAMLAEQDGKCATCERRLTDPGRAQTDHCHRSGKVRAILCNNCNAALGMTDDNSELLRRLADYADAHRLQTDSPPCDTEAGDNSAGTKEQPANGPTDPINVQAHATQNAAQISNEADTRRSEEITP